jgi:hypothetical protein
MPSAGNSEGSSKTMGLTKRGTSSTETMPVPSPVRLNLVGDLTTVPTDTLRRRSVSNLLRMGHCAPTVMQTLLDASETEAEWLVKLTAGLPGGIGNTGAECGGVTAPLVLIGLRHARDGMHDGLPAVIDKGHDLLQRFAGCHGTTSAARFAAPPGCHYDALGRCVRPPSCVRRRYRAIARVRFRRRAAANTGDSTTTSSRTISTVPTQLCGRCVT